MKKLSILIIIATFLSEGGVAAQRQLEYTFDTTKHYFDTRAVISSGVLMGTGSLFTFVPGFNDVQVGLRNAIQADGHNKVTFDNVVQYAPLAAPPVLNICGLNSKNELWKMSLMEGGSYLFGGALLTLAKYGFSVERPDQRALNSFPSGHTFTAFVGAEVLRREYGKEYPWIAVAGYTVATFVAAMRLYNDRHWMGDVLAGAGLAVLSVNLVYWTFE